MILLVDVHKPYRLPLASRRYFFIAFMCARASPLGPVACPKNPTWYVFFRKRPKNDLANAVAFGLALFGGGAFYKTLPPYPPIYINIYSV